MLRSLSLVACHTWSLGGMIRLIMDVPFPLAASKAFMSCRRPPAQLGFPVRGVCRTRGQPHTRLIFQISTCFSPSSPWECVSAGIAGLNPPPSLLPDSAPSCCCAVSQPLLLG